MEKLNPTFQHGFGFAHGEGVFQMPNGSSFDTRVPNQKKGIAGSPISIWEGYNKLYPNVVRKQGQDYSKLNQQELRKALKKRAVQLRKGEVLKDLTKTEMATILTEWEKFLR